MTNHFGQSRSDFRTGEPKDHLEAKEFIGAALKLSGYDVQYEYPLVDPLEHGYKHKYDVVAFKKMMVIEIDDPNLHAKKQKRINDKIAKDRVLDHFPHTKFLRLDKYEVLNEATMPSYLNSDFWPYV